MGRLADLNKKDIKQIRALNKALALYGLTDDDLESLKYLKQMKNELETLREEIKVLRFSLEEIEKHSREEVYNARELFNGERLRDE